MAKSHSYWPAIVDVEVKAGDVQEVSIEMQQRANQTVMFRVAPIFPFLQTEREVAPPWVRPVLIASGAGIGLSLAVGLTGVALMATGGNQSSQQTYNTGLGLMIGGSAGLGLSLFGLIVGIVSTPPTPPLLIVPYPQQGAVHQHTPKPVADLRSGPKVTVSPIIGGGTLGMGVQGQF